MIRKVDPLLGSIRTAGFCAALMALSMAAGATCAAPARLEGDPSHRAAVLALAYVLGEAHALHRVCAGLDDDLWRGRMSQLINVETPDPPYRQQLMARFNAGYLAGVAASPACTQETAETARRVAQEGRRLSARLAAPSP